MTAPLPDNVGVWLISMARSPHRRTAMDAQLRAIGLDYTWFEGIDGTARFEDLSPLYNAAAYARNTGQPLIPGHVGCYQSHLSVWRDFLASDHDIALIFEDDIVLHDDFLAAVHVGLGLQGDWDMLRFNAIRAKLPVAQRTRGGYTLNAYVGPFTGNGTYLITRALAKRLLAAMPVQCRPLDHELNRFFVYNYRLCGLEPFATHPDDGGDSTITGQGFAKVKKPKWYKRLPYYGQKVSNYGRRGMWLLRHGMLLNGRGRVPKKSD